MTIQITRPEVEMIINRRLETGPFNKAEDVILYALKSSEPEVQVADEKRRRRLPALWRSARHMVLRLAACRSVNCAKRRGLEPYRYRCIDNLGVVFYRRANASVASNSWGLQWWRSSRCSVIVDP
jgi:hypothetical protein